jgi:hypothetical protein
VGHQVNFMTRREFASRRRGRWVGSHPPMRMPSPVPKRIDALHDSDRSVVAAAIDISTHSAALVDDSWFW